MTREQAEHFTSGQMCLEPDDPVRMEAERIVRIPMTPEVYERRRRATIRAQVSMYTDALESGLLTAASNATCRARIEELNKAMIANCSHGIPRS
jgi:IS5 family transposase